MSDGRYQGFTNFETWAVDLWLNNSDERTALYWQQAAKAAKTIGKLADKIQAEIEAAAPDLGAGVYADLLSYALNRVDWYEVAETMTEKAGK